MARRLTSREKVIFVCTVLVIVVYIAYVGLVKPMKERISLLESSILDQKRVLKKDLQVVRRASDANKDYNAYVTKFKQTKSNEQIMSTLINQIEDVANELDLRISDLKPSKVKTLEYYNHFPVSLTINSEFVEILKFLYKIQSDPYKFDVDEVRFDKSSRRKTTAIKTRLILSRIYIPNN